jgi:hypothetical protein
MIRFPAGFDGGDRIKRYLDYYQPSYGVMMLSAGQFSPASLFAAGEQGAWYDPSDFSTMFQDAVGTTPVTAVEQPVGLLLDKSGRDNHASQSTPASRPVLSARVNLLTQTENFSSADWVPYNVSKTAGSLTLTGTSGGASQPKALTTGVPYRFECQIKKGTNNFAFLNIQGSSVYATAVFDVNSGVPGETKFSGAGFAVSSLSVSGPDADGYYTCGATLIPGTASVAIVGFAAAATGNTFDAFGNPTGCTNGNTLLVRKADLRVTNDGVGLPAYQAVVTSTNYSTSGFPLYLRFDGSNDALVSSAVDFSSTSAVSVWAGVRKISDAARATVIELTASAAANNGAFQLTAPNAASATYAFESKGTVLTDAVASTGVAAPITSVLTGLASISVPSNILQVNGAQVNSDTGSQGTGNYANAALYIGARGGTSQPFNGRVYTIIVRGAASTTSEIVDTNAWVNNLTAAY